MKRILASLLLSGALTASASTMTFSPSSQTITMGSSTTVDVYLGGLSANQAIGAYDFFVLNDSSILTATNVTFFSSLGTPASELTASTLATGSTEGAETSFETTAALLALQSSQPFSLFEITYMGVGLGTSTLTLGTPEYLADGSGNILSNPAVTAGSITVVGTGNTVTPEPSAIALLGSGCGVLAMMVRRRRTA